MPIPLPCPVLMQQIQAPMPALHLPANNKHHMPHASSDHRWTVIPRIREESSSRCVLPSDLFSFPFITFTAKVRDKELDHPIPLIYSFGFARALLRN